MPPLLKNNKDASDLADAFMTAYENAVSQRIKDAKALRIDAPDGWKRLIFPSPREGYKD